MPRKKEKQFYIYECSVTNRSFKLTQEAPRPDELICVEAYYEMHPEEDDRPLHERKQNVKT